MSSDYPYLYSSDPQKVLDDVCVSQPPGVWSGATAASVQPPEVSGFRWNGQLTSTATAQCLIVESGLPNAFVRAFLWVDFCQSNPESELCKLSGNKNPPFCGNGGDVPQSGKPCDYRTGAKYRNETDFSYGGFTFTRNYHSQNLTNQGFGLGWHNQFFKHLEVSGDNLSVFEGTGRGEPWRRENGVWTGDADSDYLIIETASGFTVTLQRGDVHEYDLSGTLLSETDPTGKVTSYAYDVNNRLITVTDHYQQSINFEYSTDGKNHVVSVTDATGVEYGYEYDANDNLIAVIYPDQDTDPINNPRRIYHYEDASFPNHLTGITNANGERYATFAYAADGKAIESALSPTTNTIGQERVQLNFQGAN